MRKIAHSRRKFLFFLWIDNGSTSHFLMSKLSTSSPSSLLWMFNIISSDISHSLFNDNTKIQRVRSLLLYSWAFYIHLYLFFLTTCHPLKPLFGASFVAHLHIQQSWYCFFLVFIIILLFAKLVGWVQNIFMVSSLRKKKELKNWKRCNTIAIVERKERRASKQEIK